MKGSHSMTSHLREVYADGFGFAFRLSSAQCSLQSATSLAPMECAIHVLKVKHEHFNGECKDGNLLEERNR